MNDKTANRIGNILAGAVVAILLAFAACGCACDRAAYVRQSCGEGGTNVCIVVIMPEGGATILPMGDSAIKAAVDAYLTGTGIGAAGGAVKALAPVAGAAVAK